MSKGKAVRMNAARLEELALWKGPAYAEETYSLAEEVLALREVLAAARCIRHQHDALSGEGMVVSAEHVRKLREALADYDEA